MVAPIEGFHCIPDGSSHLMYDPYSHEQSCNPHQHQKSHWQNKRIKYHVLVQCVAQNRRERGQSKPQSAGKTLALRVPHQETVADRSDDWNQWDCYTEAHEDEVDPGHEVGVVQGVVREDVWLAVQQIWLATKIVKGA